MNRAQVLDAWRVARERAADERRALRAQATEWVARRPELCDEQGRPCPFAVEAAMHYKTLGGSFTAEIVRRHRDLMVARRCGHDTGVEAA